MIVSQRLTENLQVQSYVRMYAFGYFDMIWLTNNSNQEQNQEQDQQIELQNDWTSRILAVYTIEYEYVLHKMAHFLTYQE